MNKYLILFFLMFSAVNAEVIKSVQVDGNFKISDDTIIVYGDININANYNSSELNEILKKLYSTDFFETIDLSLKNGLLKINVKEYQTINAIEIEGEKTEKIKVAILERLDLKEKDSFIKSKLSDDINKIKKIYASLGFTFVNVEAKIENFDDNRLNLIFFVEKGNKTKIKNIYFIGDKKIKDRRLRDIIVSEEHKFWKFLSKNTNLSESNLTLDKSLLIKYYKSRGYYDVQVISSSAEINQSNGTSLTFNINAGKRYKITKISTDVDPVFDKNIFIPLNNEYKKVIGKYYSPLHVKDLLDELDIMISNNDLQFVEHSVNEIVKDKSIELKINIFEGEKNLVERINIFGNSVTNESVIRGELLLDEGDPFSSLRLDKSIAQLKARRIFGEIKKTVKEGSNKDLKIIDITLEEKPTGEISAGAGVGTNGGSVAFDVTENNWLGRGIELSSNLEVDAESLKGGIFVTNPNYNFSGNELNANFSASDNDKTDSGYKNKIISTGVGTRFEQYKDIYLSPRITLTRDSLSVSETGSASLKKQAGNFTDLTFDYGIGIDKRDRAFMPTNGYVSNFAQQVPLYADSPFLKNTYSYSGYNSFGADVIGSVKFYTSAINGLGGDDVRISKRIIMPNSRLRGFEAGKIGPKDGKDFVGGNYASALNFESNLPNLFPESTKLDIGLFLDIGNVWGVDYDKKIDDSNKIRSSTGLNASWTSPVGPMSFIFSKNIAKAATDVTEGFNFRLGTTFWNMKKNLNLLLIIIFSFFINIKYLNADTPHFIDFTKVLNKSIAGADAQKLLKKKLEYEVKKYQKLEIDLRKEEKSIVDQKKIITNEEYQKKVQALRKKVSILQKNKQKAFNDIAKLRATAKEKLLKALNPIIKSFMEKNKIRLVMDKKSILLGDTNLEITSKIIDILNKDLKSLNLE